MTHVYDAALLLSERPAVHFYVRIMFFCCTWRGFQSMVLERRDIKKLINDLWTRDATNQQKQTEKETEKTVVVDFFTDWYLYFDLKIRYLASLFFSCILLLLNTWKSHRLSLLRSGGCCVCCIPNVLLTFDSVLFWTNHAVLTVVR